MLLALAGKIEMGAEPSCSCFAGSCVRIPTGGKLPEGADAVVMLEYCEEYGDGTIGVARPVAPGDNVAFRNDDVKSGQTLIPAGSVLHAHHIGTLASLGIESVDVRRRLRVGIISTGDEIVPADATPIASQMRDVNAPLLEAAVRQLGATPEAFPIVPDEYDALLDTVRQATESCDMVLVSGGSSAGEKDNTARVLSTMGELLFHGVAVKPGKPTMCADIGGIPAFGLPGHPVAAYFMFLELVKPLIAQRVGGLLGAERLVGSVGMEHPAGSVSAVLAEGIPSNHGRAELVAVRLEQAEESIRAVPVRGKSGLISQISGADGYVTVTRNQEGLPAEAPVDVKLF